jgi:radical SAM protein with 4Fe4S-binding SPASM domain
MFPLLVPTKTLVRNGDVARDQRRWPDAREAYARALRRKPSLAHIWVQYGHALKESGAPAEAEAAYRRSLALRPDVADTHLQLGRVLVMLARRDEAVEVFARGLELDPKCAAIRREWGALRERDHLENGLPALLRFVIIGSTGLCNASCIHCPTGKAETADAPRVPMPMVLFRQIFESIVELDLPITDQISLGLFGDALVDPFVVERMRFLRALLPETRISLNTNGAAFNPARHAALDALTTVVALHVESLIPETYNDLMRPLRLANVLPKFDQLLHAFPGKVLVSVPISRRNLEELPAIREYFLSRGASAVVFDPLSSRCTEDLDLYRSLAIDPHPIRCSPEVLTDLIIDCDGKVLTCCQDFRRAEPIGDLTRETLREVLTNARRAQMREIFAQGRHTEVSTCARCYSDLRGAVVVP